MLHRRAPVGTRTEEIQLMRPKGNDTKAISPGGNNSDNTDEYEKGGMAVG